MTFLELVNRMLRQNGLIRGDTDTLTSFSDTNHNSTSQIAQIAVQSEISELSSRGLLPYQHTIQASIALATSTRSYSLPAAFIQLWGDPPFFLDTTQNYRVFEYPGGENQLRNDVTTYRTQAGAPIWWYQELGQSQKISFFPVPDASVNGRSLSYDYEASVNVLLSSDTVPLPTVDQQYAFCDMAVRRFKLLFEGKIDTPVDSDPIYREARARLYALIKGKQAAQRYGAVYVGSVG